MFVPPQQQTLWLILQAKRECEHRAPLFVPTGEKQQGFPFKGVLIEGFWQVSRGLTSFPARSCHTQIVTYRRRTMLDNALVSMMR